MKKYIVILLSLVTHCCLAMKQSSECITEIMLKEPQQLHDYFFKEFSQEFKKEDQSSFIVRVFCTSATLKCCTIIQEQCIKNKLSLSIINLNSKQLIVQESKNIRNKLQQYKRLYN